jgi:hypothetical protein
MHVMSAERRLWRASDRGAPLGGFQDRVRWDRRASHEAGGFEPLPSPAAEAEITMPTQRTAPPTDHLVCERSPAFLTYGAAAAAFFHAPRSPGGMVAGGVVLRVQDHSGRLTGVRIGDGEVQVSVDGDELGSMIVHVAGDIPGPQHPLGAVPERQVV